MERDRLINQLSSNIENKEILNVPKFDQNYYLNFFDLFFTSKKLTKILSYNYNIELHKNFFNTEINGHHSSAKIIVDQVYKNLKNKNKNFVCKHYFNKINLINKGKKWAYFLKRNILAYYNLLVKKNLIKKKNYLIINFREIDRFKNFVKKKRNLDIINLCDSFTRKGFFSHKLYLKINLSESIIFFFKILKIFYFSKNNLLKNVFINNNIYLISLIFRWTYYYNYYCNCYNFFKNFKKQSNFFSTNLTDVEIALANRAIKNNSFLITAVPHSPYDSNLFKNIQYDKIIAYSDTNYEFYKLKKLKKKNIIKMYNLDFSKKYKFKKKLVIKKNNKLIIFTDFTSFYESQFNFKNLVVFLNKMNKLEMSVSIKMHPLLKKNVSLFRTTFPNLKFLNVYDDPSDLIQNYKKSIFISSSIISGIDLTNKKKYLRKKIFSLVLNPLMNKDLNYVIKKEKIKKINLSYFNLKHSINKK